MSGSSIASSRKDRRTAVFLCVALVLVSCAGLSGCSHVSDHPLLSTLARFVPGHTDVSARAKKVPYASIDFTVGHRNGLLILADKTKALTFWKASQSETVVLRNGVLQSTSGLDRDLLMTRTMDDAGNSVMPWQHAALDPTVSYNIVRSWTGNHGNMLIERAKAKVSCEPHTAPVKLPLATLALRKCTQTLDWALGQQTQSVFWVDPKTDRVWAADMVPWPGAARMSWKVARPWW